MKNKPKRAREDDEIQSDSESSLSGIDKDDESEASENETIHEKRLRLAKKALLKAREQVRSDDDELQSLSARFREEALLEQGRIMTVLSKWMSPPNQTDIVCLGGHKRAVSCVCVTEDCRFMFSGGKDSCIMKWDLLNLQKLVNHRGGRRSSKYTYHTGPILSIAVSSDAKYLASSSVDESVIIWDPETMKVRMKLKRHRAAVTAVAFRKNSHMLFTADLSGRVCVWNMPLSQVLQDQGARTKIEVLGLCGLSAERCVSCSGFGGPGISIWKVPEEICVQYVTKNATETAIECVHAVTDQIFVGGSATNTLYVWHSSRGSPVCTIANAHPEPKLLDSNESSFRCPIANWISAISGLAGTDLLVTGASTGHMQFWRIIQPSNDKSGSKQKSAQQHFSNVTVERLQGCCMSLVGFINSLTFTPDRQHLIVGLGQEHRLGKWEPRRPVDTAICVIPLKLPVKSASYT